MTRQSAMREFERTEIFLCSKHVHPACRETSRNIERTFEWAIGRGYATDENTKQVFRHYERKALAYAAQQATHVPEAKSQRMRM